MDDECATFPKRSDPTSHMLPSTPQARRGPRCHRRQHTQESIRIRQAVRASRRIHHPRLTSDAKPSPTASNLQSSSAARKTGPPTSPSSIAPFRICALWPFVSSRTLFRVYSCPLIEMTTLMLSLTKIRQIPSTLDWGQSKFSPRLV